MKRVCTVILFTMLAALLIFTAGAADPIKITSETDMLCLMNQTSNASGVSFADWTADYVLTADITMTAAGKTIGGKTLTPKPIGLSGNSFGGTFDGGNHTVTFADRCYSDQFSGLFGLIEYATVKNVTVVPKANKGNIFEGLQYVGGVVAVARDDCLIENCTYTSFLGNTNKNCKGVGGIVGRIECGANKTVTIRNCVNKAEVAGYTHVGGIVGLATGVSPSGAGKIVIENCMNTGHVRISNAGTQNAGGIVGFWRTYGVQGCTIRDCLNTGVIKSMNTCAGGIIGKGNDKAANTVVERCVNAGRVFSENKKNWVHGIVGAKVSSYVFRNCFDMSVGSVYSSETDAAAGYNGITVTADTDLSVLGENWVIPTVGTPELAVFHAASSHGKAGTVYLATMEYDADKQAVVYVCPACETVFYEDTDLYTEVYVDAQNGAAVTDAINATVGSAEKPFALFADAMRYAAAVADAKGSGVTVHIVGTASVGNGYTTPACTETITVTGGTLHFGGADKKNVYLGGPLTFRDITFTAEMPNPGLYLYAQNHKLTMDTGIKMANGKTVSETAGYPKGDGVKMYLHGGFDGIGSTEQFTMDTDVTIRSGDYWLVAGWNEDGYAEGTGRVTVGKKNADDELFIHYLAAYSRGTNAVTGSSKVTLLFDGEVNLHIFYPNTMNPPIAGYADALYETDLLLLGDLNTTPRTAYGTNAKVDIDGATACTNTVLNVYTDMRLTKAIKDTALFDQTETDSAVSFDASFSTLATQISLYPYSLYCVTYLDGHVGEGTCTECGASLTCAHPDKVVETAATCSAEGSAYCSDCGVRFVLEIDPDAHDYGWVATADGYAYVCAHNAEHVLETVTGKTTAFYVSDDGSAVGGFSAKKPSNDFDAVMRLAAAADADATVYIVGTVTVPDNEHGSYEIYREPAHANTVTVRGVGDALGVLSFGRRNVRMGYILSGDTTFENIEFTTGVSKGALYITAEHHHLTMGENIAVDIQRNLASNDAGGKVILVGGCYQTFHEETCSGTDTYMTVLSGNYFSIIGGSANKTCGLPEGTIYLELLGDFTVGGSTTAANGTTDRMLILGTQGRNCGDIVCTIDGNITSRNAVCVGAYGAGWSAKNVTVSLVGGSLIDYSFGNTYEKMVIFDETYNSVTANYTPGTMVIFPFGNDVGHAENGGIMQSLTSLTVLYDPTSYPSTVMADTFRFSLGGADNFTMDVFEADPCTSVNGKHTPLAGSEETVLEATCKGSGSMTYTCETCGEICTVKIDALPHAFGEAVKFADANCVSAEVQAATCMNDGCGYVQYTAVGEPSGEHVFENGVCTVCNADRTALCAHVYGEPEAIDTGCGSGTRTVCTLCGKEVIDVVSTNHSFTKYTVTVAPTDLGPGVKTRSCKKCGKVETALLYLEGGAVGDEVISVDGNGDLTDFTVETLKLSKAEKAALNALLQTTDYGSEVKVSYATDGTVVTGVTYSIPLPAAYTDMQNVKVFVRDGETLLAVDFRIEKGYIVFTY